MKKVIYALVLGVCVLLGHTQALADDPKYLLEEVVVIGMVASDIEIPPIDIPEDAVIEDIPEEEE